MWVLVSLVPWYVCTVVASLTLCGISGCSGGGFGRVPPDFPQIFGLLLAGAFVVALPFSVMRWTRVWWVRSVVSIAVLVAVVVVSFLLIDHRPGDLYLDFSGRY